MVVGMGAPYSVRHSAASQKVERRPRDRPDLGGQREAIPDGDVLP